MKNADTPTVLLVHGAWHGAWCWEAKFAPYLREQGLAVETMNLPGHGTPGTRRIGMQSVRQYTDAVEQRIAQIGGPVVVAGHSMGGFVVQKLMERRPAQLAGAVLMAAATPYGVLGVIQHLLLTRPRDFLVANLTLDLYHLVRTPDLASTLFYSPQMPHSEAQQYWESLSNESYRAFLDMMGLAAPRPGKADPALPKWIIGGEKDAIFPPKVIERTARAYNNRATIYPDMGHNLMVDVGWEQVADDFATWLRALP